MARMKEYGMWLEDVRQRFVFKTDHYPEDVLSLNLFKDLMNKFTSGLSVRECVKDLISDYEYQKYTENGNNC